MLHCAPFESTTRQFMKWTIKSTSNFQGDWSLSASARSGRARCRCCCGISTCRSNASPSSPATSAAGRGRAFRHKVHCSPAHARQLSRAAGSAARQGRFPAQSFGGCFQRRADRVLLREGRDVSRYLHRALARRVYRSDGVAVAPLELRLARRRAGLAREISQRRADGDSDARRQSGPDFALGQTGADQYRARSHRKTDMPKTKAQVGAARDEARRESHPLRRARHAGGQPRQAAL